ncbi:MAG: hypothetical protein U0787_22925 [Polyangia bacterium]|nr:hypothetical protein [Pseudomonadota bacterium]
MRSASRGLSAVLFALALWGPIPSYADEVPSRPAVASKPAEANPALAEPRTGAPAGQPAVQPAAPQPDKDGFVPESRPMNGPTVDESIPAGPLVAAAYGFLWLAVLGYVLMTGRGLRKVDADLAELDAKISRLSQKS